MVNKAVFLDRDGVINKELGDYVYRREDFEINDGFIDALKVIRAKGFLIIVVTNQGGIAKEIYGKKDVENTHEYLIEILKKNRLSIDAIYYCPHHPEIENCICRKPNSNMMEKAISRFKIQPSESIMIGDKKRDIEAARKVGVNGMLIEANNSILEIANSL